MSVEWFDLGQRLRAASTGRVVPRLVHAALTTTPHPVACRAHRDGARITVVAAIPGTPGSTATGQDALDLLGDLGVTLAASSPATLVTDDPGTLPLLCALARSVPPDSPRDTVAGHIAWWADRADFPGGRAVVDTRTGCRTRRVTGTTPTGEDHPATWRHWLDVPDETVTGLLALYQRLTDLPPLPWLDTLAEDDLWAYATAQSEHADGMDWRRPDTTGRAALGLRSRCDAADLYAAALLTDPLYRRRATHTGHVTTGVARPLGDRLRTVTVTCPRLDCRLRPGTDVTGWVGTPTTTTPDPFSGTVTAASVEAGHLLLTLTGTTGTTPQTGATVTLMPAPPSPHQQRVGRKNYRTLYSARRSWLTTGRPPTTTRRPVPLDVLIAGAEP